MPVYDADAHVEESVDTFSDKYLDPAFRARRPQVVGNNGQPHWLIDYNIFPRFTGPGAQSLGTPTTLNGEPSIYTKMKPESVDILELRDPAGRVKHMRSEDIDLQVLYPTLFLAYNLTPDPAFAAALCSSYNRWLADVTSSERECLKWVAVANLSDVGLAVQELRRAKELGALGVMIGGTAGDKLLSDPSLLPFFEEAEAQQLPVAVHVAWSSPSFNGLFHDLYSSTLLPFVVPVMIGFVTIVGTGILDRFPSLRVGFFEAGCQWIHFVTDRMDHRWEFVHNVRERGVPATAVGAKERSLEYVRRGSVFFSIEVEDKLLPQAIELVGAKQLLFGSDMPHNDRERWSARTLRQRTDITPAGKDGILYDSARAFYRV
ncbi:MAG TPA: amidohydrolase family protein [Chloroflexota bacterium]|nr:amidohydrolase family protein [Chloroflexota bacterium]